MGLVFYIIPHRWALDPADIKSIQCVVGCVEDRGKWRLVDAVAHWHTVFSEAD